jgi:hypothetical protein
MGTRAHAADRVILDRQALAPFIRSCMPHGVRHPGGETDRQSPCRGRAARILARTIRMPPVSSIWIPGRRWAPALDHPTVRNPVGGHARERHGGAGRRGPDHQGAGGYGCPGASVLYLGITLSDERGEGERAHCRRSVRRRLPERRARSLCVPRARGWRWSRTSTWHKVPRRRAGQSLCQAMRRRACLGSPGSRRCRARPKSHLGPPVGADSPQKPVPKSWRGTVARTCCW